MTGMTLPNLFLFSKLLFGVCFLSRDPARNPCRCVERSRPSARVEIFGYDYRVVPPSPPDGSEPDFLLVWQVWPLDTHSTFWVVVPVETHRFSTNVQTWVVGGVTGGRGTVTDLPVE